MLVMLFHRFQDVKKLFLIWVTIRTTRSKPMGQQVIRVNADFNPDVCIATYIATNYLPGHQYVMIYFGYPVYFCLQFLSGQWNFELKLFYLNEPS